MTGGEDLGAKRSKSDAAHGELENLRTSCSVPDGLVDRLIADNVSQVAQRVILTAVSCLTADSPGELADLTREFCEMIQEAVGSSEVAGPEALVITRSVADHLEVSASLIDERSDKSYLDTMVVGELESLAACLRAVSS